MDVGQNYVLRENLNTYPFNQGQNKQCLYKLRQFKPKIIASNHPSNINYIIRKNVSLQKPWQLAISLQSKPVCMLKIYLSYFGNVSLCWNDFVLLIFLQLLVKLCLKTFNFLYVFLSNDLYIGG